VKRERWGAEKSLCVCEGGGITGSLSSQLPMVPAVLVSGDGRDERYAAGAAVRVPLICQ
jgi:hypothetical protein